MRKFFFIFICLVSLFVASFLFLDIRNQKKISFLSYIQSYFQAQAQTIFVSGVTSADSEISLKFINEQVWNSQYLYQDTLVGGLSALTYNKKTNIFLAVSDDYSYKRKPRFYKLRLTFDKKKSQYAFTIVDQIFIQTDKMFSANQIFAQKKIDSHFVPVDFEGITFLNSQQIFISSEGVQLPDVQVSPVVSLFDLEGQWILSLPLPKIYWPKTQNQIGKWGVKSNKGFESLSLDPTKKHLWVGTEVALHQDQLEVQNKQFIRLSRFDSQTTQLTAQVIYKMDVQIQRDHFIGKNGLTDFVALGGQKFITIERAYVIQSEGLKNKKPGFAVVRLFFADCSMASDTLKYKATFPQTVITCEKKPLIDLASILGRGVDNIEGITLVPDITTGKNLLVLVSDNNFNHSQKTQFLFFDYSLYVINK